MTNPMRDALLKARDWFTRALADEISDDYLNDDGWNEAEGILDAINAALVQSLDNASIRTATLEKALQAIQPLIDQAEELADQARSSADKARSSRAFDAVTAGNFVKMYLREKACFKFAYDAVAALAENPGDAIPGVEPVLHPPGYEHEGLPPIIPTAHTHGMATYEQAEAFIQEIIQWQPALSHILDIDAVCAALEATISIQPSPAYEWQPIESAPKDGRDILAFVDGFCMGLMVLFWSDGYWREKAYCSGLKTEFTHWMPLPEPPRALLNKDGG